MNTKVAVGILAAIVLLFCVVVGLAARPKGVARPSGGWESLFDRLAGRRALKPVDVRNKAGCVLPDGTGFVLAGGSCEIPVPKGVRRVKLQVVSGTVVRVALRSELDGKTIDQRFTADHPEQRVARSPTTIVLACGGPCRVDLAS